MSIDERPKRALFVNAERELVKAIVGNDLERVSTWLARGAEVNARGWHDWTPLFWAGYAHTDPGIAELLFARGADVRARDASGRTPLHVAVDHGDEARIGLFLDRGAEIDARDDMVGWTPLHCAARHGRLEAATFLVSRGSDVDLRDRDGLTPLDLAREHLRREYPLREQRWEALERLLAGFATAKVIEARSDSLIMRVESVHSIYPEAYWQAKERGLIAIPAGLLRDLPEPGHYIECPRGLSPVLDEAWDKAWRVARRKDLGIEPVR
jgi:Ankyrin repeats (3 copies)